MILDPTGIVIFLLFEEFGKNGGHADRERDSQSDRATSWQKLTS